MSDTQTQDLRAEIAAKVGIEPDKIKTVQLQLDRLRRQGLLIDLNVSGTGIFSKTANWSDLGIKEGDDPRPDRFTRGQKYLIPEVEIKRLRSVETKMRQWLNRLSYDIHGFKPYRWLPVTAYSEWRRRFSQYQTEFEEIKADILANYDTYIDLIREGYTTVAEASWKSIKDAEYEWVIIEGRSYDREGFIEFIIRSAIAAMPTREAIEKNVKCDYVTALVYGAEDVAKDQANAEEIRAKTAEERTAHEIAIRAEDTQLRILEQQQAHENRMQRLKEQELELQIDNMLRAEVEHARTQLGEIVNPYAEVFSALRNQIAQDAAEMLESIKKSGHVQGKVAERGLGLLDTFELLAVHDDFELHTRLKRLRAAIGPVGNGRTELTPERNPAEVAAILEQIRELSHTAAQDLIEGPSRFSLIE
jgi:hypothetical protein